MVTLEFRDGQRDVPDHVGVLLQAVDTHKLTYDQAIAHSQKILLRERLNQSQRSLITEHFRELR